MPICLYCKERDRSFTSVEHAIPESLGNQGLGGKPPIVLPRGVVCDTCNHGPLSNLDNALIDYSPISLMRTFGGVRSKSGKLPSTKLGNATLRMVAPGHIVFESNSKNVFAYDGKDRIDIQRLRRGRPMTPTYCRTITRALFKMTLGCMYVDLPEVALSERFDPVRRIILGSDSFHGYFFESNWVNPPASTHEGVRLSYGFFENDRGKDSVWCHFCFLGFEMFTDLQIREWEPPAIMPKDAVTLYEF